MEKNLYMTMASKDLAKARGEWPTLALLLLCYALWGLGTTQVYPLSPVLAVVMVVLSTVLHASLTHEALHGHPFANRHLNAALVFPALTLVVPYIRFRDTHLAHHLDSVLTDPYDDPESNYQDPAVWQRLPRWQQALMTFNNRLLGRLLLGPLLGQSAFMWQDAQRIRAGDRRVLLAWVWHLPAAGLVLGWMIWLATMPLWLWTLCLYAALAILKIRTFLEHQAHLRARGRTVIVEDRGPLALLFLNNNLHVVHHMHPRVAWFRLPHLFRARRARYLTQNEGYYYPSYLSIFRQYFWRAKDPVPHPLWPKR